MAGFELRELAKALTSRIPSHVLEDVFKYAAVCEFGALLPGRYIIRERATYVHEACDLTGGLMQLLIFLAFGVCQGNSLRQ